MRILIADDDEMTLAYLTAGLNHGGFQVDTAADAMQAVMKAIRTTPDAVILDIQMPGGTGITALKRIKHSDRSCLIPVMTITGTPTPELRAQLIELGAVDCLPKPVDVGALSAWLTSLSDA